MRVLPGCLQNKDKNDQRVRSNEYARGIDDSFINNANSQTDIQLDKKSTSWTSSQRAEFMSECLPTARKAFGNRKGQRYCECMMNKVESKFPDYSISGELLAKRN